eukprot:scaffold351_cov371-Prasinococcus_capsulatus_cf.AAC.6
MGKSSHATSRMSDSKRFSISGASLERCPSRVSRSARALRRGPTPSHLATAAGTPGASAPAPSRPAPPFGPRRRRMPGQRLAAVLFPCCCRHEAARASAPRRDAPARPRARRRGARAATASSPSGQRAARTRPVRREPRPTPLLLIVAPPAAAGAAFVASAAAAPRARAAAACAASCAARHTRAPARPGPAGAAARIGSYHCPARTAAAAAAAAPAAVAAAVWPGSGRRAQGHGWTRPRRAGLTGMMPSMPCRAASAPRGDDRGGRGRGAARAPRDRGRRLQARPQGRARGARVHVSDGPAALVAQQAPVELRGGAARRGASMSALAARCCPGRTSPRHGTDSARRGRSLAVGCPRPALRALGATTRRPHCCRRQACPRREQKSHRTPVALASFDADPDDVVKEFAYLDFKRRARTGLPEVVWGPGKSPEQISAILERLATTEERAIATRVTQDVSVAVGELLGRSRGTLEYEPTSRILTYTLPDSAARRRAPLVGKLAILSAGTADTAVAQVRPRRGEASSSLCAAAVLTPGFAYTSAPGSASYC